MFDDDEETEIPCPYCDSTDDCPHLLAVLDRSFLSCSRGYCATRYEKFDDVVAAAFKPLLLGRDRDEVAWDDDEVAELWRYALESFDAAEPDADVAIDGDVLMRMVRAELDQAGGEEYQGQAYGGDGPGNSSVLTVFHASDPSGVFASALSALANRVTGDEPEPAQKAPVKRASRVKRATKRKVKPRPGKRA